MQVYGLDRHHDHRGCFEELFNIAKADYYHWSDCHQINHSVSEKNVLRGIHVASYPKMVRCIHGNIYDVVVDLRPESPTYGSWVGIFLYGDNAEQVLVPAGCGHAFYVVSPVANVVYLQGGVHQPGQETDVHFESPALKIDWPGDVFILSAKDRNACMMHTL